jgi:SAM-dependent methyltransferase
MGRLRLAARSAVARRLGLRYALLRSAVVRLKQELAIARAYGRSTRRFRLLDGCTDLKIHLGCGNDLRPGWVNIDRAYSPDLRSGAPRTDALFIDRDLRLGLPLQANSCAYIYSSHFFEHLEYQHGLRLMRDCYHALRPGGVFRVAMPDFRAVFVAYLNGDQQFFDLIEAIGALAPIDPATRTLVDYVNYAVYQFGEHTYIYDQEKFYTILRAIGFSSVVESSFQSAVDPDTPLRRKYSFYIEAVK